MIIGTAIMLSVIGILKRLDMLILPWWRYPDIDHSFNAGAVSGVYVNKNHMAGFLEMAIPFSIVLLFIKSRSRGSILLLVALVLFLLTVQILTLSRGGWVSSAVSLVFLVSVMISTKGRFEKLPFMAGGLCIIVLFLFFIFNSTAVKRASSMTDYEKGLPISGRLHCWKGTVNQIKDNWLSGTGPGTFAQAYPQYQLPGSLYLQRYTHNDYLNFTAETGVFFVPVTAVVLYIVFKTGFNSLHSRSRQKRGLAAASMAGILAILIHSFGDFNLNIPANAFLFVILGAILASTSEMTRTELRHQSDSTILP
jgi:O-antigen ligase